MSNFSVQQPNLDLVNWLSAYFTRRNEPNFSLAKTISTYMTLPGLRGFWPSSVVGADGQLIDKSDNGLTLTRTNTVSFQQENLIPYVHYSGSEYHSRTTESLFDIIGTETYINDKGLVLGAWIRFDNVASAIETIVGKFSSAAGQRSYVLDRDAAGNIRMIVSVDGSVATIGSSTSTVGASVWRFVACRFIPSTEISVWIDTEKTTTVASIPASIFNSTTVFEIAGRDGANNLMTGDVCLSFLCASALSDAIIGNLFQQTRGLFNV